MSEADDRIKAARKAWERYQDIQGCHDAYVEAEDALERAAADLFAAVDERDELRAEIARGDVWALRTPYEQETKDKERIAELEREILALVRICGKVERGEIKPTIGDLGMHVHIARGGTTD
jgi:hypothetical protein